MNHRGLYYRMHIAHELYIGFTFFYCRLVQSPNCTLSSLVNNHSLCLVQYFQLLDTHHFIYLDLLLLVYLFSDLSNILLDLFNFQTLFSFNISLPYDLPILKTVNTYVKETRCSLVLHQGPSSQWYICSLFPFPSVYIFELVSVDTTSHTAKPM